MICMDEIFSRWYGLVGDCINLDFPHYVNMDWNPDSGWKIQDTWCVRSTVILKLILVNSNTADEYSADENGTAPSKDDNYGTK